MDGNGISSSLNNGNIGANVVLVRSFIGPITFSLNQPVDMMPLAPGGYPIRLIAIFPTENKLPLLRQIDHDISELAAKAVVVKSQAGIIPFDIRLRGYFYIGLAISV